MVLETRSDGSFFLRGIKKQEGNLEYFSRSGFNVTPVISFEGYGRADADGQYSGMIGQIQRNEVDVGMYPVPTQCGDVGYYSPAQHYDFLSILSLINVPKIQEVNLFDTLKVFQLEIIVLGIAAVTLLNYVHHYITKMFISIWLLFSLFCNIHAVNGRSARYIQLYVSVLGFFLFLTYSSLVVTNMTYAAPRHVINNLHDLDEAQKDHGFLAKFCPEYPMIERFKEAKQGILHDIWRRTEVSGEKMYLSSSNADDMKAIEGAISQKLVYICAESFVSTLHPLFCNIVTTRQGSLQFSLRDGLGHISDEMMMETVNARLISKNVTGRVREKLDKLYYSRIEFGLMELLGKSIQKNSVPMMPEAQHCYETHSYHPGVFNELIHVDTNVIKVEQVRSSIEIIICLGLLGVCIVLGELVFM